MIGILSSAQNNAGASPEPGFGSHLYWRVNFLSTASSDSFKAAIAEVEFRESIGGADQCAGGTATGSTEFGVGAGYIDAFDNDNSTAWACASGQSLPQWIGYQFSSAVEVAQISMTAGNNAARAARAPNDFTVDYSDDGSTWTTALSVSGEANWGGSEQREYAL